MSADRGRDTSRALTEMRTVLSRAKTALASIMNNPENEPGFYVYDFPATGPDGETYMAGRFVASGPPEFDPDCRDMTDVLTDFITRAERWERTGR